jgi:hypothetical protein
MPIRECRFCNKYFNSKTIYYNHLHIHLIDKETEFTQSEIELAIKYHESHIITKKKSYYN